MRNPLDLLPAITAQTRKELARVPVPYVAAAAATGWKPRSNSEGQMRAMGGNGTLFAIVDRLAASTSAVRWDLYRTPPPGRKPQPFEELPTVPNHLALDIWRKPNPFFTRQEFVETFQQHYDLVGEAWWVVARNPQFKAIPLELWPVSPARMVPVPDPDRFLAGYVYNSPGGEEVPLGLDEVIQLRRPNPWDPYRGIGPVQTIVATLQGVALSEEWNRNFFLNSAEPGGIIEVPTRLNDGEFNELRDRWNEQHRGVSAAHRVAILEHGQWKDRTVSQRDMQFVELREVSDRIIRGAYGMSKFAVGDLDDVNRAVAEAAKAWFAEQMTVPRCERIKEALNEKFLPLFGPTGEGVHFDYESPAVADRESDDRERTSKAEAYKTLVEARVDPEDAAQVVGLPPMRTVKPPEPAAEPEPAQQPEPEPETGDADGDEPDEPDEKEEPGDAPAALALRVTRPAAKTSENLDPDDLPDVSPLRAAWEKALAALLKLWEKISAAQKKSLVRQVREAAESGDLTALTRLVVPTEDATNTLADAMSALADLAAEQTAAEAADQDVDITPVAPAGSALSDTAAVTTDLMASDLATSAAREAMRVGAGTAPADDVADAVREHLDGLSDAQLRERLGGALHRAQHDARMGTWRQAEQDGAGGYEVAYYASEKNDTSRCGPCGEIDGTFLGNTIADADREYPTGGYLRCEGRDRCRGQVVAIWRPGQVNQ
ncbi:phage portal protein [Actinomadura meridiana]